MILMKSPLFEKEFKFENSYINVLEIHNIELFREIVQTINLEIKTKEEVSKLIFLDNDNKVSISKDILIIQDYFNLDINNTKIIKQLYVDVETKYIQDNDLNIFTQKINDVLNEIRKTLLEYDFDFTYKEQLSVSELLKSISLKFDIKNYVDIIENILYLFEIISMFKICKVCVFVNMKGYLKKEEIEEVYKMAMHKNIKLLLIEHYEDNNVNKYEKKLIIDNDFDEFMV